MLIQPRPPLTLPALISPLVVALVLVGLCALLREPARQRFSAIFLAGAGAAYLSGGFGVWEFAFCAVITLLAYRGLENYRAIALGWVLHTCWDAAHHLYGNPIIPFAPLSSVGCAICDLGIAAWYFAGAPGLWRRSAPTRVGKGRPLMPANAEARRLELGQLLRLEFVSLLEATTLVLLVGVAVPLKHLAHLDLAVKIMGPVHGIAFLAYIWTTLQTVTGGGWRPAAIARLFLVAFIPLAGFANLPFLRARAAELHA